MLIQKNMDVYDLQILQLSLYNDFSALIFIMIVLNIFKVNKPKQNNYTNG